MFRHLITLVKSKPALAATIAGWLQQMSGTGIALILIPIVTATLSPREAGIWFSFQGLMAVIGMTDLGFGFAFSRQAAFSKGNRDGKTAHFNDFIALNEGLQGIAQLFFLTKTIYRFIGCGGAVLAFLIFEILSRFTTLFPSGSSPIRGAWYAMAFASIIMVTCSGQVALLNGMGLMYATRFLLAFYQLFAGISAAIACLMGGGIQTMAAGYLICAIVFRLILGSIFRFTLPKNVENVRPPPGSLRKLAKCALPVAGVNIFGPLVFALQAPIVGIMLGAASVAPFYLAQRISQAFMMIAMHAALPQVPFFTQEIGSGQINAAYRRMLSNIRTTTLLILISAIVFYLTSPWMAAVLLRKASYVDNVTLLLMSADFFLLGSTVIWGHHVLAYGRNPFVLSTVMTGVSSLALTVLFIPRWGLVGLPLATLLSGLVFNYQKNLIEGLRLKRVLHQRISSAL